MAKKGKKNENYLPPFVALLWEMLNSKAYKELSFSAAKALPFFLGRVKIHPKDPQRYQEKFSFPHPEAERLGFPHATFSRLIRNLIDLGFLDPVKRGGLKGYKCGYSFFRLSQRWKAYGKENFKTVSWDDPIWRKDAE